MDKLQVAIITLIGILVSSTISYIIGRKTVLLTEKNLEISKANLEAKLKEFKEAYSKSIHTERVKYYPLLYTILSKFGKLYRANNNNITQVELNSFLKEITEWDENYSIFVGGNALKGIYLTRRTTEYMLKEKKNLYDKLFSHICYLEYELKKELGVFTSESFSQFQENTISNFNDYNIIFDFSPNKE